MTAREMTVSPSVERAGTKVRLSSSLPPEVVFWALLSVGIIVRVAMARTTWHQPDSDEATGMLMAYQASRGHLSLVFWGGTYGGAGITWLEAPLVALFGLHLWIFWAVDTILVLVAVLLLYGIAKRILPPLAAAAAAGTFSFFPPLWVFWSSREYVFWLPAVVMALAAGLLTFWWIESRRPLTAAGVGLCAGLAIWSYPLAACIVIPSVAGFVVAARRDLATLATAAIGGLIGVFPWIGYFIVHGTTGRQLQPVGVSNLTALRHTLTQVLPAALAGGQKRFDVTWATPMPRVDVLHALGLGIYAVALACSLWFVYRRRWGLLGCSSSILLWPFVLMLGHVPLGTATYRYGLIVVAPILILAAYLFSAAKITLLLPLIALGLTLHTASSDTQTFASAPGCNREVTAVDRWLVSHDRTAVWAAYWLAGTMEVCGSPHLVASPVAPVRDAASYRSALAAPMSTYVVFARNDLDTQLQTWSQTHPGFAQRVLVAGYAAWLFDSRWEPAQLHLQGGNY
jgi:hypothetical protein